MATLKIALTGGIACGKSTVSQIFKNLSLPIIDLDDIAKEMVAPNTLGLNELVAIFSNSIINQNNTLNRKSLLEKMLASKKNKQLIEAVLHPKILAKMQIDIKKIKCGIVVVVVPLLVELNLAHLFNRVVIVDCDQDKQLTRLKSRPNFNYENAKKIIAYQARRSERFNLKQKLPTDIIKNNTSLLNLQQKTQALYKKLINL